MVEEIREELLELSEWEYKKFTENLIPGAENILGIRTPVLRETAKKISKDKRWKDYVLYNDMKYHEEFLLQGMVIGLSKEKYEDVIKLVEKFVPRISNWAVCDTFCTDLKIVRKNREAVWEFLQKYFNSNKEYEIRFALVIVLKYFIEEKWLDKVLVQFDKIENHEYYVQMAAAWAVAEAYVKYPEKTLSYIKKNNLDDFTHNKSIQKICESLRVDKETKEYLKTLKK